MRPQRWRNAPAGGQEDEKQRTQRQLDLAREEEEKDLLDALTKLVLGSQVRYLWTQKTAAFERAWARFAGEQLRASQAQARNWESALDLIQETSAAHSGPLVHAGDLDAAQSPQQQRYPDPAEEDQEGQEEEDFAAARGNQYRNSDAVLASSSAAFGASDGGAKAEEEVPIGGGLLGQGEEDDDLFRPAQSRAEDSVEVDF